MGYMKPKNRLHREFLYLNYDTIINSLSALEAGKIDEIIQKANQAREGGFSGGISGGPLEVGGGKKKTTSIEEEMVRTRTIFSAYEAWYRYLKDGDAIGVLDEWNGDVRDQLSVGDTLEFQCRLTLTPVHKVFRTFLAFAAQAELADSVFHQTGEELKETRKIARMMQNWLGGKEAPNHFPVYVAPLEVDIPRVLARLDETYMLSPKEGIDGVYNFMGQVDEILRPGDTISAIRVIRDVPPTSVEVTTITEALTNLIEPALELGVDITAEDIEVPYPAVILRPIAVYR
jgi:hypothetical protein